MDYKHSYELRTKHSL